MSKKIQSTSGPILAIESSCDETACAILDREGRILADLVHSQQEHASFGGVVPEIAARAHILHLPDMVCQALHRAGVKPHELGAIAASCGPGLIGGLIVGAAFAKGLSLATGVRFVAINHIEAHALSARLPGVAQERINFPFLLLLVSGGHCQCIAVDGVGQYRKLGGTIDDAAGEAFDKVAKMLGLPWPGGPALEKLAAEGNPDIFSFPRPLIGRKGCDFSFSGLKTAVANKVDSYDRGKGLPRPVAAAIAAGFQSCVTDVIADRLSHALAMMPEATHLVVAGGVAANKAIRSRLIDLAAAYRIPFTAPPPRLCTDNAVMVGWAALETLHEAQKHGLDINDLGFKPRPRWPLQQMTERFALR